MRKLIFSLWVLGLMACAEQPASPALTLQPKQPSNGPKLCDATDTIRVALAEHSVELRLSKTQWQTQELPESQKRQLSDWWDSLPVPVRHQIQQKELGIELVSTVQATAGKKMQFDAGAQIEKTGEALEKIIGQPTEMTYALHTRQSDENLTADEQATSIILSKKVPVRLSEYTTEIELKEDRVLNENLQTLQYWWLTLPETLQDKIRRGEMLVNLECQTLDYEFLDKTGHKTLGLSGEQHVEFMSQVLQDLIGYQKIGQSQQALGRIQHSHRIKKAEAGQSLYRIILRLEPQKRNAPTIQLQ